MSNRLNVYVGIGLILIGLNCSSCSELSTAMPYVNAGGDMLCASVEAVKASKVLSLKSKVSQIEYALAITQDANTASKLAQDLARANAELQDAIKQEASTTETKGQ